MVMEKGKETEPEAENITYLKARGKSGILTKLKLTASKSRDKSLIRTSEDSDRVKTLIQDYDTFVKRTNALGLLNRPLFALQYQKLLFRQIKSTIIRQGFVSSSTLQKFRFNPVELIEKITYRILIEKFVIDDLLEKNYDIINTATIEEAKKGEEIDINTLSDEFYELNSELKQYAGSGEFTQAEESAGWLKWTELKNRDKTAIGKKQAKRENICFYVTYNQKYPDLRKIYRDKLLSLSTSNLVTIISFFCKIINKHNIDVIKINRKSDKKMKANSKYIPLKSNTAGEKRELVKKYKAEGKTQIETAQLIGCKERTVRNYWK